jgi:glycosyltransferase involved in cell wall biosynthesis
MRVLVWQWGRFGGAPRFAAALGRALAELPHTEVVLSMARDAELLQGVAPPRCDLPVRTYSGAPSFLLRAVTAPFCVRGLCRRIAATRPDAAVCAQPGPLDLLMAAALRRLRIPFVVLVHDADLHPGDRWPLQMPLQRALCRRAAAVGALTQHVAGRLRAQGVAGGPERPLLLLSHPPMAFDIPPRNAAAPGALRLLTFGRLLPYKGLDLLADALSRLGPRPGLEVRVVGAGPESATLAALRALPGVTVENRWVPEDEVGALLGWCDALVLPYREASQSGVAAAAIAAGRRVLATRVGGLAEQLAGVSGAILCEPDADGLLAGLRQLQEEPPMAATAVDARAAWIEVAAALLHQMRAVCEATVLRGQRRPAGMRRRKRG